MTKSTLLWLTACATPGFASMPCGDLARVPIANTKVTLAENVSAAGDLPAFCRVRATLAPSPDSDIKIEVWLPEPTRWNRKFRGTGNGGLGGGATVNTAPLTTAIRAGYATAGNNTGHEGGSDYAIGHPEKVKDFGYRASHEMVVVTKILIGGYYDASLQYSLMAESGGGTIAALSAAQRYPEDYDLLAVVSMSSYLTRHTFGQMWTWYATHESEASFIPTAKYPAMHAAAVQACDAKDGRKDGLIGMAEKCKFDPVVMECKGADAPTCLTAPQIAAARKIYAGPKNPRTGEQVYSPLFPGSELGWGQLSGAEPLGIPVDFFRYYVFEDPKWDYKARPLNFDADVAKADRPEIAAVNAVNPDLSRYFARGGKLLLIGGWADAAVPPAVAVDYYKQVVSTVGAKAAQTSMRFFMVPGMGHGFGSTGVENFTFDTLAAIEQWRLTNKAPDRLVLNHFKDGKPVAPYPVCAYPRDTCQ